MRRRALLAALALAAGACAPARAGAPAARPEGYHGIVVWLGPGPAEPTRVSFAAAWREDGGTAVPAFARAEAGDGWNAYGRIEGDTLVWGLTRIEGDAGTAVEMAGAVEADGRVRGCARRRPGRGSAPAAAFVLAPRSAPLPAPSDAPVAECRARAAS